MQMKKKSKPLKPSTRRRVRATKLFPSRKRLKRSKMSQTITISLPDDTRSALDDAATEDGLSESALIEKALSDYLFIRRFRSLRERIIAQGKSLLDQDVFDLVS